MRSLGQLVTSNKKLVSTSNKLTSLEVKLRVLDIVGDIGSYEEPNNMTAWYCKGFRLLGEGKFTAIVKMSKEAKCDPKKNQSHQKLFHYHLKEEIARKESYNS